MRAVPTCLVAAIAAALLCPSSARAYEDQIGLALGVGYAAVASDNPLPHHGFVAQLEGSLGLDDTWEVRALAGYALHVDDALLHRASVGVELVYLIDILELVPFFGLGVDAPVSIWDREGTTDAWIDFAGHAVVGLDWLLSREWAIGVEVRPYVLFTSFGDQPPRPADPVWITAILRAQMLFEI
ncbi:hypothetical protein [Sandaracinus amylolyticus]|uniref:Outer membrane protein beta-barrel domain-containing protein n=1 Tax=Sandaracinus amylolyticus TaxID=927083 RepID=A0A0F6YID5_9BACT|nr:hypothetical protein [Sandaracinus amylolyticus]AKF06907.1 hypothetical protein DB32_004056 [Sandaracinus amylolyticus]